VNGLFAIFSVQTLYGLLVLICVVVGVHLVQLNGRIFANGLLVLK